MHIFSNRWVVRAFVVVAVAGAGWGWAEDDPPANPFQAPSESENQMGYSKEQERGGSSVAKKAVLGPDRAKWNKLATEFQRGLGRMPIKGAAKKTADDYWIVGTAELSLATRAADIRFDAKQGLRPTAEFLADYMLAAPDKTLRSYHVFSRFADSEAAEQGLAAIRQQYDAAAKYREEIAKIYSARTTRRC